MVPLPKYTACCNLKWFFVSGKNRNCLFSASSIVISAENRYVDNLRYFHLLNCTWTQSYMLNIPLFWKLWIVTLVYLMELVKEEALIICSPFKWSRILCVLALYSFCLCFFHCYYQSYDVMLKHKIMFHWLIKSREFPFFNSRTIQLLFCNNSILSPTPFRHNHYVPLTFVLKKQSK